MIPRLLILIALVFAGMTGGPGASWAQDDAGHGPCGMAGEAAPGDATMGGCGDVGNAAGAPCAMAAACSVIPQVATATSLAPPLAAIARTAPIRSDRLPDGRASKPSLEPPIARG